MPNNTNVSLTTIELSEIEQRVSRVHAYLKQSTSVWLSIAAEFSSAKQKFNPLGYQKFFTDCGFTIAVADKLAKIGSCAVLHSEETLPLVSCAEGWTVLYELSKLETKQINSLLHMVANDNQKKLTRELIHNFANGKSLDAKRLVVASIELDEDKLKFISFEQFSEVQTRIDALKSEIDRINAGFVIKSRKSNVVKITKRTHANSDAMIVRTAA